MYPVYPVYPNFGSGLHLGLLSFFGMLQKGKVVREHLAGWGSAGLSCDRTPSQSFHRTLWSAIPSQMAGHEITEGAQSSFKQQFCE